MIPTPDSQSKNQEVLFGGGRRKPARGEFRPAQREVPESPRPRPVYYYLCY